MKTVTQGEGGRSRRIKQEESNGWVGGGSETGFYYGMAGGTKSTARVNNTKPVQARMQLREYLPAGSPLGWGAEITIGIRFTGHDVLPHAQSHRVTTEHAAEHYPPGASRTKTSLAGDEVGLAADPPSTCYATLQAPHLVCLPAAGRTRTSTR